MNDRHFRGGIAWPVILIGAGLILLFNNLGVTDVSLWELAIKLWPAALIAFGIDLLIPRRSLWGYLLAFVLVAAVMVGGFWLVENGRSGRMNSTAINQAVGDADQATITLDQAVGEMTLTGQAGADKLIVGTIQQREDLELSPQSTQEDGTLAFELHDSQRWFGPFDFSLGSRSWRFQVNDKIPINLDLKLGVGLADLDLSGTQLESITTSIGVGQIQVQLPANQPLAATIDGGIGEVVVLIPAGTPVEIRLDRGLSALQLPSGYRDQAGVIRSEAGTDSGELVQVDIDMGIGSIRIVEVQ